MSSNSGSAGRPDGVPPPTPPPEEPTGGGVPAGSPSASSPDIEDLSNGGAATPAPPPPPSVEDLSNATSSEAPAGDAGTVDLRGQAPGNQLPSSELVPPGAQVPATVQDGTGPAQVSVAVVVPSTSPPMVIRDDPDVVELNGRQVMRLQPDATWARVLVSILANARMSVPLLTLVAVLFTSTVGGVAYVYAHAGKAAAAISAGSSVATTVIITSSGIYVLRKKGPEESGKPSSTGEPKDPKQPEEPKQPDDPKV